MQESPSELPTMEAPIYIVADRVEYLMDAFEDCSATTKKGRRCQNPIFYGQEWIYPHDEPALREAIIFTTEDGLARALAMLCPYHWAQRVAKGEM